MAFIVIAELFIHHHITILELFLSPKKILSLPRHHPSNLPSPSKLESFCLHEFAHTRYFMQGNHTVFVLCLWFISHSSCRMGQNLIPFYGWLIFYCMHLLHFIYSSVDRHLGYLHLLATVSNAEMSISMQVSVWGLFSTPGFMPRPEMAGSYYNLMISLWGTTNLFFAVAAPFTFKPAMWKGFQSPYPCQRVIF